MPSRSAMVMTATLDARKPASALASTASKENISLQGPTVA